VLQVNKAMAWSVNAVMEVSEEAEARSNEDHKNFEERVRMLEMRCRTQVETSQEQLRALTLRAEKAEAMVEDMRRQTAEHRVVEAGMQAQLDSLRRDVADKVPLSAQVRTVAAARQVGVLAVKAMQETKRELFQVRSLVRRLEAQGKEALQQLARGCLAYESFARAKQDAAETRPNHDPTSLEQRGHGSVREAQSAKEAQGWDDGVRTIAVVRARQTRDEASSRMVGDDEGAADAVAAVGSDRLDVFTPPAGPVASFQLSRVILPSDSFAEELRPIARTVCDGGNACIVIAGAERAGKRSVMARLLGLGKRRSGRSDSASSSRASDDAESDIFSHVLAFAKARESVSTTTLSVATYLATTREIWQVPPTIGAKNDAPEPPEPADEPQHRPPHRPAANHEPSASVGPWRLVVRGDTSGVTLQGLKTLQVASGRAAAKVIGRCLAAVRQERKRAKASEVESAEQSEPNAGGGWCIFSQPLPVHTVVQVGVHCRSTVMDVSWSSKIAIVLLEDTAHDGQQQSARRHGKTRDTRADGVKVPHSDIASIIAGMTRGDSFVSYRASKVMHALSDVIGGDARRIVVACVAPCLVHAPTTLGTLAFAAACRVDAQQGSRRTAQRALEARDMVATRFHDWLVCAVEEMEKHNQPFRRRLARIDNAEVSRVSDVVGKCLEALRLEHYGLLGPNVKGRDKAADEGARWEASLVGITGRLHDALGWATVRLILDATDSARQVAHPRSRLLAQQNRNQTD